MTLPASILPTSLATVAAGRAPALGQEDFE